MNILIVGGAGYVGGGIVDNLKNKHNVTIYDSLIYEESYRKDVNFIYGDIREKDKLLPLFDQNDAVIWLAALVGDGACSINPDLTYEINSESVKFLAQNFKKRIIFLSTCSVYGAQDGLLDEESSINPLSEYASSKIQAEEYLKDTNSVIFRLGTLFGISDEFSKGRQVDYVLGQWNADEATQLEERLQTTNKLIESFVMAGIDNTMNAYNGK